MENKEMLINKDEFDKYDELAKDDIKINSIDLLLHEASKYPVYTKEEEVEVFTRYKENPTIELRNEIINHNIKFVIYIAKKFTGSFNVDFEDIVSYGFEGLIIAINKYDVDTGNKFSTYAYNWIASVIRRRCSKESLLISIPAYIQNSIYKYCAKINEFYIENGYYPSEKEINEILNVTEEERAMIFSYFDIKNMNSLNIEINDDPHDYTELGDMIADSKKDEYESKELFKIVNEMLDRYLETYVSKNKRDMYREIIKRRLCLDGENDETLEEISRDFNLSRERVRQIVDKFIKYVKSPNNIKKIIDFKTNL